MSKGKRGSIIIPRVDKRLIESLENDKLEVLIKGNLSLSYYLLV